MVVGLQTCMRIYYYRGGTGQNFCVRPDGFRSRTGENPATTGEYTITYLLK
jgi:hypothetical protein